MAANALNAPKKFLFDTSFEPEEQPEQPVEAPPEPAYFDEDLERARGEGHVAGHEAGRHEALQSIEQAVCRTLEGIAQHLPALRQSLEALQEQQTRAAVEVAAALVRKMFPKLARDHGLPEIDAVVSEAMARLRDEPRIVIRVNDAVLDTVKERVGGLAQAAGFEGRMVFLAQDGMDAGDVRVEWADGGAERDTGRIWRDIEETIGHMTATPDKTRGVTGPEIQTTGSNGTSA